MARTDRLLSYTEVAELTGLAPVTLRKYRQLGYLPEPDELPVPDRPRWRASTIRAWMKNRPGRGTPRAV